MNDGGLNFKIFFKFLYVSPRRHVRRRFFSLLQGKYDDAKKFYKQALEVRERALGHDRPDTAFIQDSLAGLFRKMVI